jgi:catechol 2,3-dioxygenase-like lactoylglutathione lyase family enzyme
MFRFPILCAVIAITAAGAPALAQPAKPLPALKDGIKPHRLSGVALTVVDIEKEKDFYTNVLGMQVVQRIPTQGRLREYLLAFDATAKDGPTLILTKIDKADPKTADFGRLVFEVPNGEALARRAAEAGYPPRRIVDGSNTLIDPEGHKVELFQQSGK